MLELEYSSERAQLLNSKDSSQIECSIWFLHQRAISNCRQYCFGLLGLISAVLYIYIYIYSLYYEKICLFDENLLKIRGSSYNRVFFAQRLRYPNNKAFLDIHDVLKGLLGLMGRSPRVAWVRLALSIALKDDLSELKSVTFVLLSICDSFAIVLKMEAQ